MTRQNGVQAARRTGGKRPKTPLFTESELNFISDYSGISKKKLRGFLLLVGMKLRERRTAARA